MTIPLFTYWEGKSFSNLHYLTILSLHKHNPDKDITIYTSKYDNSKFIQWNTGEHSIDIVNKVDFRSILTISDKIYIKEIDFDKEYNIDNNLSCVYKADIIRIIKSYEHGGIWFDFDILFIKPIPESFFINDADINICYYGEVATGLVYCKPKLEVLKNMVNSIFNILKGTPNLYQQFGPDLWARWLRHTPHNNSVLYFEKNQVYPYTAPFISTIYYNNVVLPEETWAIHWYNGAQASKIFINNLDINNMANSTFCNCIKQVLSI
jgi:hypothetical protein